MKKFLLTFFFSILFFVNTHAKDIGIAWEGKASMQDAILKGFLLNSKTFKKNLNIEIKKELKSVKELKELALKWDKEKDAMILLRSSAAKMLTYTKTNIPTFIGGCNHPVALGTVDNFLSPSGNITGVTYYLNKKPTLKMIKLFLPDMKSILFLGEKNHFSTPIEQKETKELLTSIFKIEYNEFISDNLEDILEEVKKRKDNVSAIILGNQALVSNNARIIASTAGKTPVFSYGKSAIKNGALAGYVADDFKLGIELSESVYSVLYENKQIKDVPIKIDTQPIFYVNKTTLDNLKMKIPYRLKNKVVFIDK